MSKITFQPIEETVQPLNIDIDVTDLYDSFLVDIILVVVLLTSLFCVVKKLK